jgi:hypothetical protein
MGRHSAPDEPDLDSAETTELPAVLVDLTVPRGRHSQADEQADEDDTATIDLATIDIAPGSPIAAPESAAPAAPPYAAAPAGAEPGEQPDQQAGKQAQKEARDRAKAQAKADKAAKKAEQAEQAEAKAQRKQAKSESNTRADLRMLRQNGAVRAQALAAVIVSFLLYTIVMVVIGRTDVYLEWLWIPIVLAGFLVGLVLDLGHRRANKS